MIWILQFKAPYLLVHQLTQPPLGSLYSPRSPRSQNLADVRERLRTCLGKIKVLGQSAPGQSGDDPMDIDDDDAGQKPERREIVYTEATKELVEARKKIVQFR